ncbi:MAG: N-acetylneuraminate synthase family protein [bacterium]|nr:N-acetylneuraminate synthase family protein [bacterium]MDZ4285096.1 N-acetylneuraminate synthase family protein [Patescibacteria group bacterium]
MTKLIVELCQNHNGDREIFAQQIRAAAENGADIVKMQSMWSEDLRDRSRFEEGETHPDGSVKTIKRPFDAERERLAKLDLTLDDHRFFIEQCVKYGVVPMTTIFARHRVPGVGALPWPERIVKVASYDCASPALLRELAEYFDRFIISTGATYDEEIEATASLMRELGKEFTFLHCVTSYPNTLEMAHLARMDWLRQHVPQVGWSDHTHVGRDGITAAKVAIMLGADYVERHFTVLAADQSKDGPVSITPKLLAELDRFRRLSSGAQRTEVERDIPLWQTLLGSAERDMTPTELLNRDYYRGRFASPTRDGWVYNWEEIPLN